MVDRARRWIYRAGFSRHENSKDGIREAAEFAEGAAEKGMGMADMCEKHGTLGGVGVDVVRYYVGA